MSQRIVVALGGNALGKNLTEQYHAVRETAKVIVDLIADGNQVVIAHGNGPQVGMIQSAMTELTKMDPVKYPLCPLPVCVAMSQGYIGYDLQRALGEALQARELTKPVSTVLTQVEVDPADPAFQHPTKPIGSFMTREEAEALAAQGFAVMEDAGRGYRRVVASPRPKAIVELETVRALMEAGQVVVACGGGGIPYPVQRTAASMGQKPSLTRILPPSFWLSPWMQTCSSSSPPWSRWPSTSVSRTKPGCRS